MSEEGRRKEGTGQKRRGLEGREERGRESGRKGKGREQGKREKRL